MNVEKGLGERKEGLGDDKEVITTANRVSTQDTLAASALTDAEGQSDTISEGPEKSKSDFSPQDQETIARAEKIANQIKSETEELQSEAEKLTRWSQARGRGGDTIRADASRRNTELFERRRKPYLEIMQMLKPIIERTGKIPEVADETFLSSDFVGKRKDKGNDFVLAEIADERSPFSLLVEGRIIEQGGLDGYLRFGRNKDENPFAKKMTGDESPYAYKLRKKVMDAALKPTDEGSDPYYGDLNKARWLFFVKETLAGLNSDEAGTCDLITDGALLRVRQRHDQWIRENPDKVADIRKYSEVERVNIGKRS